MSKRPVLIELDADAAPVPVTEAPALPDTDDPPPEGRAMQGAVAIAARRSSRLGRWLFGLGAAFLGAVISVAAWEFAAGLLARNPVIGATITALGAAFLFVLLLIVLREVAALGRLRRVDALRNAAEAALAGDGLEAARAVSDRLVALYRDREETRWGRDRLSELGGDQFDARSLLALTETELLSPLDRLAVAEVERAARQVAAVTALVPLALADVVGALAANLRMIRRIAEIYGGRAGTLGSWRLARAVMSHLVATGAVAVGDDMLEPVLGGSILGKLSRRFGEGLVNGALTARVGVAAMEVCRPLPFSAAPRPRARDLLRRALAGFVTG